MGWDRIKLATTHRDTLWARPPPSLSSLYYLPRLSFTMTMSTGLKSLFFLRYLSVFLALGLTAATSAAAIKGEVPLLPL
jgi:hypothetical protein